MKIQILLALLTALFLLTGCSSGSDDDNVNVLTESIRKAGDSATGLAGGGALTEDNSLQGERTFGADEYAGTYQAEYEVFSSTELLFGGASFERKTDDTLDIQSNISVQSGEVKIYWNTGGSEPELLFQGDGEHSTTIELKGGWEYLSLEGEEFTGEVRMEVE